MDAESIDILLERYLGLLDEYTELRSAMTAIQSDMFQSIARANFSSERGIRYGQVFYDDRMQASRTLKAATSAEGHPVFEVVKIDCSRDLESERGDDGSPAQDEKRAQSSKDPLRWFGLLAPLPLRQAQSQAVQLVENVIPRLVSVNAELAQLEIQVRRARKKRAKAEAAKDKDEYGGKGTQVGAAG
jgi:hypothetical protein